MKTINVSDKDYEILMELSKELQLQENDHQAFPYYWEARSDKMVVSLNGEGEYFKIYYEGETHDIEYFVENYPDLWLEFLKSEFSETEYRDYEEDSDDLNFADYIINSTRGTEMIWYTREQECRPNPSLFKEDVKNFIKYNSHHLGENPHTYANSVWRMPKMEALIKAIYRLNPQPKEIINKECERFVYEDDK